MTTPDPTVLAEILDLLDELAGDWEDLGLESLEIVVLGTMIQERFGRLPFAEYLDELGQRPVEERDVSVAEVALFVCEHRQPVPEEV
jgi:acyl carrier protein